MCHICRLIASKNLKGEMALYSFPHTSGGAEPRVVPLVYIPDPVNAELWVVPLVYIPDPVSVQNV